jgi:cobalt-zinc-cadmium efflux system outer membrane protein
MMRVGAHRFHSLWRTAIASVASVAMVTAVDAGSAQSPPPADRPGLAPLTRAAAIDAALRRGPRGAFARVDTVVARAALTAARGYPNPVADLTYTRAVPYYHGVLSVPIDYPWVRGPRVRAAELGLRSAGYRYAFERASVRFEVDSTYTRALAAAERAGLSHRNAVDADSLRRLAIVRREVGDASDLDVDLATVNAGQVANVSAADSLAAVTSLLDLQSLLGLPSDQPTVTLVDSLTVPDVGGVAAASAAGAAAPTAGDQATGGRAVGGSTAPSADAAGDARAEPLPVAAAAATLQSEEAALAVARRGVLAQPSIQAGLEGGDPSQPYLLPTVGVSLPVPLFNRDHGEIALATASRDRARLELDVVRRETAAAVARAAREFRVAMMRVQRDSTLLDAASHVAARSLTAFAEGASALTSVIEAQRSAREARGQYVDDLAAANTAAAAVQLAALTAESQ